MIGFVVFPIKAIRTIDHRLARSRIIIFLNDIVDHTDNAMSAAAAPPTQIAYCVVSASQPGMTPTLHGVSADGAGRGKGVT